MKAKKNKKKKKKKEKCKEKNLYKKLPEISTIC